MTFEDHLREVFQLAYRVHLAADGTARSAAMLALSDNLMTAAGRAADGVLDPVSLLGLIYEAIEGVDGARSGGVEPSNGF